MFYLHWIDVGVTYNEWLAAARWDPSYAVSDEEVIKMKISHDEGQIPSLSVTVRNPQVGLLSGSRSIWAWFSWDNNGTVEPLFFGRLVGIPSDLLAEAVTLEFTARHRNYVLNKQVAAEALKVRPYYDPVFIDLMKRDDPDAVLEGYSKLWHTDRTSLAITPSDILVGEDGDAIFTGDEVPYDSVRISIKQVPLRSVYVQADVNWSQEFVGYLDTGTGLLKTYTGDGVLQDWPKAGSSLGGGWSVVSSFVKDLNRIPNVLTVSYNTHWQNGEKRHNFGDSMSYSVSRSYPVLTDKTEYVFREITRDEVIGILDPRTVDTDGDPAPTNIPASLRWTGTYVPQWRIKYSLGLRYDASRTRVERIEMTLKADTQDVLADATLVEESDTITLSGNDVGKPIINFRNWSSVAGKYVELGTFIFPDNPDVAGQKSIQVCVISGIAGNNIPVFSNVAGVTTQDGSVTWSSLGSATGIYNISADWSRYTEVPLGEIILPKEPFSLTYKDFIMPGKMQDPEVGVPVNLDQIVEVPNYGFYECTLSGTTNVNSKPNWKTDGSDVTDGTVVWSYIGRALPTGVDYYICTSSGVTGSHLPRFGDGTTYVTDGGVVWTKLPVTEVPVGGAPGKTPRNNYFPTDRGRWSIEYLLCLARARLRMRARAVEISFKCRFERAAKLSCRMNATIYDRRIQGGMATGKIIGYTLEADGNSKTIFGTVKIGCSVGKNNSITFVEGDPVYAAAGYMQKGYQAYENAAIAIDDNSGDIGYTPPISNATDTFVYPLTADQVFLNGGIVQRGSVSKQVSAIQKALDAAYVAANYSPKSIDSAQDSLYAQHLAIQAGVNSVQNELQKNPVWLEFQLKPVSGTQYENFYSIETTELLIPKTIDLEADSNVVIPPASGTSVVYAGATFRGVGNGGAVGSQPWRNVQAVLSGSGTVGAIGDVYRISKAALAVSSSMVTQATVIAQGEASFDGETSVTVASLKGFSPATATVSGDSSFTADSFIPTIAFDAQSGVTLQTAASFSFTHTPVGVPKGVLVFITGTLGTDTIASVTYGGVPMNEVHVSPNLKSATEQGAVYAYFLGENVPTGPQTVAVTGTASGSKNAYAYTVTASPGRNVTIGDAQIINSNAVSNPSVTLSLQGKNGFCALAFASGVDAVSGANPLTNWTSRGETDHGTQVAGSYSYDIIGNVDVTAGWTQASDDATAIAVALVEGTPAAARVALSGESDLNLVSSYFVGSALLAGSGAMGTETVLSKAAATSMAATGDMSTSTTLLISGSAAMAGSGRMNVVFDASVAGAAFQGSGTMSATALAALASAALSGSGIMGADAGVMAVNSASLVGDSTLQALANQLKNAGASFSGSGSFSEIGTSYPGASLAGSGGMLADGTARNPNFDSVVIQMSFVGTNGATSFTDDSKYARTITTAGNAQIQSNRLELDGTTDYLTAQDSADWQLTGDFTLEFFGVQTDNGALRQVLASHYDAFSPVASNRGWALYYRGDNAPPQLDWVISTGGGSAVANAVSQTLTAGVDYDICLERSGSTVRFYVNGTMVGSLTQAGATFNSTSPLALGSVNTRASATSNQDEWDGRLKAFRFTQGKALYASDSGYSVPALPLPTRGFDERLLEDGTSYRLLEDGSKRLLE